MEDKTNAGLKKQRERRKRVNRMKLGLVMFMLVWMMVSMVVCVTLVIKVYSLERQVGVMAQSSVWTGQVSKQENEAANYQEYDALESTENDKGTESLFDRVRLATGKTMSSADKSNRAEEGDELKVYLTFDDGPSSNTSAILDILAKYDVKATFFVVGKEDEESKLLYKRIVDEGHTLGMHSYTHKYSALYDSLEGFAADFTRIQNLLYDVTGVDSRYYRFPGGSSNRVSNEEMQKFISYLNEQGITYFDWNVSSGDATSQAYTSDELVDNVVTDVVKYKTSVVLMHDSETKPATVEALEPMIKALKALDAKILPIDENTTAIQHITANSVE